MILDNSLIKHKSYSALLWALEIPQGMHWSHTFKTKDQTFFFKKQMLSFSDCWLLHPRFQACKLQLQNASSLQLSYWFAWYTLYLQRSSPWITDFNIQETSTLTLPPHTRTRDHRTAAVQKTLTITLGVPQNFHDLCIGGILTQGPHYIPTLAVEDLAISCSVKELESFLELCRESQ